ncbi:DUF2934 domain-containing protein [Rhizobium helianthi]|uniref:DUF2934 domain-containing protein n=1 Tax=Rhizobium helianthi TaxID=1132695 RepID=A0ABW4M874_9HYPH
MADSEDWIKHRAYELWEAEGRPHGKHDEHWKQATAEFHAKHNGKSPAAGLKAQTKRKAPAKAEPAASDPSIQTSAKSRKPKAPPTPVAPVADPSPKRRTRKATTA